MSKKLKKIVILGATGSVGMSAFKLVEKNSDKFQVVGASAHTRFSVLEATAESLSIPHLFDSRDTGADFKAFLDICAPDIVLNAVVGFAGLAYSLQTLEKKIPLALANKESLVAGGEMLLALSAQNKIPIIPVDSEHSAIFDILAYAEEFRTTGKVLYKPYQKILLTCSGGPFRGKTFQDLETVTLAQALKHPSWSMGAKITIDSATLANKCLEFFEAMYLFGATKKQVEIVIHPQSIVHSMVEFVDGSVAAQLSPPTMELPIALAMTFPDREDFHLPRQSFADLTLQFASPDLDTFRTLRVLEKCTQQMKNFPIVFNAANEVLVDAFLHEKIRFVDLFAILEKVIDDTQLDSVDSFEKVVEIDAFARKKTQKLI